MRGQLPSKSTRRDLLRLQANVRQLPNRSPELCPHAATAFVHRTCKQAQGVLAEPVTLIAGLGHSWEPSSRLIVPNLSPRRLPG